MTTESLDPDLLELLETVIAAARGPIRTGMPARVRSYNRKTQTVTVAPLVPFYNVDWENEIEGWIDLSPVTVPVQFPGSGPIGLTFELEPGTDGWLAVCDRDTTSWESSGGGEPTRERFNHRHSVFIPGASSPSSALEPTAYSEDGAVLRLGQTDSLFIGDSTAALALAVAEKVTEQLEDRRSKFGDHIHPLPQMQVIPAAPGVAVPVLPVTPSVEGFTAAVDTVSAASKALADDPTNPDKLAALTEATEALAAISPLNTGASPTKYTAVSTGDLATERVKVDK